MQNKYCKIYVKVEDCTLLVLLQEMNTLNVLNKYIIKITQMDQINHDNSFLDVIESPFKTSNPELVQNHTINSQAVLNNPTKYTNIKKQMINELKENRFTSHNKNETEEYNRATKLISKMNAQRRSMNQKKEKMNQKVYQQVQESLKKIDKIAVELQKQKQAKRQKIKSRIRERKFEVELEKQYNRAANFHLAQLSQPKERFPIIRRNSNPNLLKYQNLSLKKYRRSVFMDRIQEQQRIQRLQENLKNEEKFNVWQTKKAYGKKHKLKKKNTQN